MHLYRTWRDKLKHDLVKYFFLELNKVLSHSHGGDRLLFPFHHRNMSNLCRKCEKWWKTRKYVLRTGRMRTCKYTRVHTHPLSHASTHTLSHALIPTHPVIPFLVLLPSWPSLTPSQLLPDRGSRWRTWLQQRQDSAQTPPRWVVVIYCGNFSCVAYKRIVWLSVQLSGRVYVCARVCACVCACVSVCVWLKACSYAQPPTTRSFESGVRQRYPWSLQNFPCAGGQN